MLSKSSCVEDSEKIPGNCRACLILIKMDVPTYFTWEISKVFRIADFSNSCKQISAAQLIMIYCEWIVYVLG